MRDKRLKRFGGPALLVDDVANALGARFILNVVDGNLGSVVCEQPDGRTPDASAGTGYEDYLVRQKSRHAGRARVAGSSLQRGLLVWQMPISAHLIQHLGDLVEPRSLEDLR